MLQLVLLDGNSSVTNLLLHAQEDEIHTSSRELAPLYGQWLMFVPGWQDVRESSTRRSDIRSNNASRPLFANAESNM